MMLRPWQTRAATVYRQQRRDDFLLVATPGAGKTDAALAIANELLETGVIERILVVCHTDFLKRQWATAASGTGLQLDTTFPTDGVLANDYGGAVVTYQQVRLGAHAFRALSSRRRTLVILDEIHHAAESADGTAWGDALTLAFGLAARRLLVSGTPFRSDARRMPFVRYGSDGICIADFTYSYADALNDGFCRQVLFPHYDGTMEWLSRDGEIHRSSFVDPLEEAAAHERLRTALSPRVGWLPAVLREANEQLVALRLDGHRDAAGLVVCMDTTHADLVAQVLKSISGAVPVVVHSELVIGDASDEIAAFRRSSAPWLIAVRMVSEGVDIPRLRVGVYATNILSELFFRQFVGRFVRMIDGLEEQSAYMFLPAEPTLLEYAHAIGEEARHALNDEVNHLVGEAPVSDRERTESLFTALGAEARFGGVIFDEEGYTADELTAASTLRERLQLTHPAPVIARALRDLGGPISKSTPPTDQPTEPLTEQKQRVRAVREKLVRRFANQRQNGRRDPNIFRQINDRLGKETGAYVDERITLAKLQAHCLLLQKWMSGDHPW